MDAAFAWIGEIIGWLGAFVPRLVVVRATHRGVKWVRGKHVKAMEPGLHWYWPITTEIEVIATARQTLNMNAQTLITEDKKPVVVCGVVVYYINDVVKAIGDQNYDVDDTIADLAQVAVVEVVTNTPLDELSTLDDAIIKELTKAARRKLKKFGVQIEKCFLTEFCTTSVVRVIQNE